MKKIALTKNALKRQERSYRSQNPKKIDVEAVDNLDKSVALKDTPLLKQGR